MGSESLEAMLAPISDTLPCGEDLRASSSLQSVYDELRDARRSAGDLERAARDPSKGEAEDYYEKSLPHWQHVRALASTVLTKHSKDLMVVSFLIEAEARLNGFAGLRGGFCLARDLIEGYWDCLYPRPDEDGLETRLASFASLNGEGRDGTLIGPIFRIPLSRGATPVPHWLWIKECEIPAEPKKRDAGYDELKRLASETKPEEFDRIRDDLESCILAFSEFSKLLDKKSQEYEPPSSDDASGASPASKKQYVAPSSRIKEALASCRRTLRILSNESEESTSPKENGTPEQSSEHDSAGPQRHETPPLSSDKITTRESAFQQILEIADFFRRTEPHSPISYALEQVVRWGRMPLDELLNELITDEKARNGYRKLAGIRVAATEAEEKKESG